MADACGFAASTVSEINGLDEALACFNVDDGKPPLQVMDRSMTNAYPKLVYGSGMSSMEPNEKPLEMEGT